MKRLTTLLATIGLAVSFLVTTGGPASATTATPSISDRPPAPRFGATRSTSPLAPTSVDAANAYTYRFYPSGPTWVGNTAMVNVADEGVNTGRFFMHGFWIVNGDSFGGYAGIQTHLTTCNPGCVDYGHGFIFSVWGATGGTPAAGGTLVSGTENGRAFYSIHFPFAWVAGHNYDITVGRSGTGLTDVTATITDKTVPAAYPLGTLTVPSGWGGFLNQVNDLTEEYSPNSYASCTDISPSRATWLGTATHMTPSYPHYFVYPTSSSTSIQTGTGCSNSAVIDTGTGCSGNCDAYKEVVGATS